MRKLFLIGTLATATACQSATDAPAEVGQLRTQVVAGKVQTVIAGAPRIPDYVVGQAQRVPPGASLTANLTSANATASVQHLPNVVMCVGEEQMDLIPFSRCINTDGEGKGRFTFSPTTKAGNYRAKINFTMGLEESTVDSVLVTVGPDTPDTLVLHSAVWMFTERSIHRSALVKRIRDKYGNDVPATAAAIADFGTLKANGDSVAADSVERTSAIELYAGVRSATTKLSSVRDLRGATWTASGRCAPMPGMQKGSDNIDSVTFDLTSRSVDYVSLDPSAAPAARIVWDGVERFFLAGGKGVVIDTLTVANDALGQRATMLVQRPDSLGVAVRDPNAASWSYVRPLAQVSGACLLHSTPKGAFTVTVVP